MVVAYLDGLVDLVGLRLDGSCCLLWVVWSLWIGCVVSGGYGVVIGVAVCFVIVSAGLCDWCL